MTVIFTVPLPIARPRQRHTIRGKGSKCIECGKRETLFVLSYTPEKHPINAFKQAVALIGRASWTGPSLGGPFRADMTFVTKRPKADKRGHRYRHIIAPDKDNFEKGVLDALSGIIWKDDKQVCAGDIQKFVAASDERPHVEIRVTRLEG